MDFWGQYRRAIISAKANLDNRWRTTTPCWSPCWPTWHSTTCRCGSTQEQIELARQNAKLQSDVLKIVQARFDAGTVTELDVAQQQSTLSQTEATDPGLRNPVAADPGPALHLVGHPAPRPAKPDWDGGRFPRRRRKWWWASRRNCWSGGPDIRAAERTAAAQAQQIGIAQADLYPHISITGSLGYSAQNASQLFTYPSFNGSVGPSFTWNILNYGRFINNVRLQDAKFQQTLLDYRTAVLTANQEAEDGMVAFLKSQERTKLLTESVVAADKAFQIVVSQYRVGTVDFNRLATIETNLVQQQDLQTQARGQIAMGLVQVYRALGGGWEIRLGQGPATGSPQPAASPAGEEKMPHSAPI